MTLYLTTLSLTALLYTAVHSTALECTGLHCTAMHSPVLHCQTFRKYIKLPERILGTFRKLSGVFKESSDLGNLEDIRNYSHQMKT